MTAVEHLTYDRLLDEQPAAAGFTMSIASTVKLARAGTVFVKAGQVGTAAGDAVTTGAQLAPVIGDLGPPLVGHLIVEGWSVAVYDFIAGTALGRWDESAVLEMAEISFRLRERVDPSPITDTTPYAQEFAPLLGCWEALEDPNHPDRRSVEHIVGLDLPNGFEVSALAELERRWFEALGPGRALQHGDLRADNVVREPSGRLWLVDWTHKWTAPGWADLVRLAPDMAAHGGQDPEAFLRRSAWNDAPRDGVDVMLAGLAGRCWRDGHLPAAPGLPHLRQMQLEQGDAILHWLAVRAGLR
ncbi:aminoglycoside phosphotransferase [Serinicoccus chungangensis]|uniref:aminoglycoside phosphotransferase n=1 Tax=Serinicoccus chungangensis TaxID=767452 RepID=UPI00128F745B|nr:aminoglycoside phosphotransferase [Serinicoccus chungangensis]